MTQLEIEQKYDRKNIRAYIAEDIGEDFHVTNGVELLEKYMFDTTYYKSKLDRIAKIKHIDPRDIITEVCIQVLPLSTPQPIQSVVAILSTHLGYKDVLEGVKTAAEILAVLAATDIFDLIPARMSESGSIMIVSKYRLEDSTLDYINQTKYLPPMICNPNPIISNYCSGYLTRTDSVILGSGNYHTGKQGLDVLNILNQIPLAIDIRMYEFAELSKKPLDTAQKETNFRKLVNDSNVVIDELLGHGNKFWLTHKVDKRGRMYCQGYHVSYQASEYKKSLINLFKRELIV